VISVFIAHNVEYMRSGEVRDIIAYTLLYVWCDFKAQKFELLTDPFLLFFRVRAN